jgi:hypothetical protein
MLIIMNLLIGSSHSNHMYIDNCEHFLCSAGSAKGLNNTNSVSKYNEKIIKKTCEKNYKRFIFMFGSVDTDFSFIHKYLDNASVNYIDFNKEVVDNYLHFIKKHFKNKTVIILSIGLPTLNDENLKNGLLNGHINYLEKYDISSLKKKIENTKLPDIYYRTIINMNFNLQLKANIEKLNNKNIRYLDVTEFTFDNNTNRIKDAFFTKTDHHNFERNKTISKIINDYIENNEIN